MDVAGKTTGVRNLEEVYAVERRGRIRAGVGPAFEGMRDLLGPVVGQVATREQHARMGLFRSVELDSEFAKVSVVAGEEDVRFRGCEAELVAVSYAPAVRSSRALSHPAIPPETGALVPWPTQHPSFEQQTHFVHVMHVVRRCRSGAMAF